MTAISTMTDFQTKTTAADVEMKILWLGFCGASQRCCGKYEGTGSCDGTALCILK